MSWKSKIFLVLFIAVSVFIDFYFEQSKKFARQKNLNYSFSGIISNIKYDGDATPFVTINGTDYHLSPGYNFKGKLERGDSLIKVKGSRAYRLIKRNSKEVIIFKN